MIRGGQAALDLCLEVRDFVLELEDPAGASYLGEPLLYPETKVLFEPPLSNPGKIICPGLNFEEHVTESKSAAFLSRPPFPMAFARFASTLIGHRRPVIHPSRTACLDYEVEMAVIIGTEARSVPREKALSMVWGYTVFNDLSVRDLQLAEMKAGFLLAGKNMDTLGPIGPWAVTAEEIRDPHLLDLRLKVNGELRQSSSTRFMIYRFDELIAYWSSVLTLHPGDIITSGTPSGVAMGRKPDPSPYYLKPGDVVEAEIENIGTLVNPIVSDSQRHQQSPR
ncbi:MAG: fumarylacetoacetate hydrolase family protein [Firmicutes bacterium]|nr:fumarylacetoacetate hydrolase family protein [Bacillota bacterium]